MWNARPPDDIMTHMDSYFGHSGRYCQPPSSFGKCASTAYMRGQSRAPISPKMDQIPGPVSDPLLCYARSTSDMSAKHVVVGVTGCVDDSLVHALRQR